MSRQTTPSQTVGPFFQIGLTHLYAGNLAGTDASGECVTVKGRVLDGDGAPVNDAILEIWQADAQGQYAAQEGRAHGSASGSRGFARVPTDESGNFAFTTIKPGRVPAPGGVLQAPHLLVAVFMRGLLKQLISRMYFPGEASNPDDPILRGVPAERRDTLIAKRVGAGVLTWNVILQGRDETVFFDY